MKYLLALQLHAIGSQNGNYMSGIFATTETSAGTYSMTQTGSSFTLEETGSLSTTTTEGGNAVTGDCMRSRGWPRLHEVI